jgi:hypothetical protein
MHGETVKNVKVFFGKCPVEISAMTIACSYSNYPLLSKP